MNRIIAFIAIILFSAACRRGERRNNENFTTMTTDSLSQYGYNRDFLEKYVKVIELGNGDEAIALVPEWQGRVMTSTAEGDKGFSFGWINHKLIASGVRQPHINAFGGEERLWLGPEGGQFSIYFRKDDPFLFENWQVPEWLDTKPFGIVNVTDSSVLFSLDAETVNYSGTELKFRIEREVKLLSRNAIRKETGFDIAGLSGVGYMSANKLINKGSEEWKKETGMLSVWMLGMFNPSPMVTVVIPVREGDEKLLGPKVNDSYFGKISADRLKVVENHLFFRTDGKSRGKIGISPLRAAGIMGSYDSAGNFLTLLVCSLPKGNNEYVNSAWEIQKDPFSGDAFNSYNDGPLQDGSQMGPFYELETSSPAAALKPGEEVTHVQYTLHLTGDKKLLNEVSVKALGVSLEQIENAFR